MAEERHYCRKCGNPVSSDAKFCRYCGCSLEKAEKPKRTGPVLLVFLAAAVFAVTAFVFPGWLKKPVSPEGAAVLSDLPQISVNFSEYSEVDPEALQVVPAQPVLAQNGDYLIRPYEVDLGNTHELSDFAEIRIPYDASFMDAGEDPKDCVGGFYYNEATGEWEETLYSVDTEKAEVVIRADHFSTFGAMTVKNKGKRDAYLTGIKTDDDFSLIDEAKALNVMTRLVESSGEDTTAAKIAGSEVLQAVMSLHGAASTMSDVTGNAFNIAAYLDISDLAMQGRYVEQGLVKFPHHVHYETVSFSNNMFQTYNRGMIDTAGTVLSNVGITLSGCKLAAMVGKAAAGKASDAEILGIYKDAADLAVSIGGSATLGALMGPVWLADQFVSYCFEEGMQVRQDQMAEMYTFFNTTYEGSPELHIRPGRSLKDWRARIIELIDGNPDEDSARLLRDEVDSFAEDFWKLDAVRVDNVAASAPKKVMRIPFDDAKLRRTLTEDYKKQLYLELYPVMTSVRNYYNEKMLQAAKRSVSEAKRFYNRQIRFSIIEPLEEGETPQYAGCKVIFAPLRADADVSSWSSVIPPDGGELYGEFSLIGHITAGSPKALLVFDKDADIAQDEPLLSVPLEINDFSCKILLERKKPAPSDISPFLGFWYDEFGLTERVIDYGDGTIGLAGYLGLGDFIRWKYTAGPDPRTIILSDPTYGGEPWGSADVNKFILSEDGETMIERYGSHDHPVTREKPDIGEPFDDGGGFG